MAYMGDYESNCATCVYEWNHKGEEPCKSCKIYGVGEKPSNYVKNEAKAKEKR